MLPSLPFGPLTLPTGPVFAMLAVIVALDIAGRYSRRLGIHPDDLWNTGLLGVTAGLIVARLWNVFQFWPIYRAEPLLIVSLRPSGFDFWPGLFAALVAGYGYLLWRALPPVPIGAALAVGLTAGGVLIEVSGHLTGETLGLPTDLPWQANYFGQSLHPVGPYRAAGLLVLAVALWFGSNLQTPARTIWLAVLGYSLIRLVADGFLAPDQLIGPFRQSQVLALVAALVALLLLSRRSTQEPVPDPIAALPTIDQAVEQTAQTAREE